MKNVTLTDADLTAYSGEHLLYELQYFWFTASELSKMTKPAPLTSVFIESFGIHLRNLIDFFFTTLGDERPDDVIAEDFCPGWKLSHLTLQRKAGFDPTKPWNIVGLFNEIMSTAQSFAVRADGAKLSPDVGKWLSSRHTLHGTVSVGVPVMVTSNTTSTMTVSASVVTPPQP